MLVFLSYNFDDEDFVRRLNYFLRKQPSLETYCYADDKESGQWPPQVDRKLFSCEAFTLILGRVLGNTQRYEARAVLDRNPHLCGRILVVRLPQSADIPKDLAEYAGCDPIRAGLHRSGDAETCARDLIGLLRCKWIPDDDLPSGYPFSEEKAIIDAYVAGKGGLTGTHLEEGCAETWPRIELTATQESINPVPESKVGKHRTITDSVIVDARAQYHRDETGHGPHLIDEYLTVPEAGPRQHVRYPRPGQAFLRAGVLVSGGIAPGINAVIDGIVERHALYERYQREARRHHAVEIRGYREGFNALLRGGLDSNVLYTDGQATAEVRSRENEGGSILSTSRAAELLGEPEQRRAALKGVVDRLQNDAISILYVIGGDGSMRAAHAVWKYAQDQRLDLSVVGIPKTMDNDILWVWQSFGFLSAVERAKQVIHELHTEARSNPRLCIVQLFGSDSGFVVSHAALGSGVCDLALIPEVEFSMVRVCDYVKDTLSARYHRGQDGRSPYGMILMAEAAIPTDVKRYLHDSDVGLDKKERAAIERFLANGRRVQGQTSDELRSAGLKIVSRVLQREIKKMAVHDRYWEDFRVFTNEPRHVIRAIPPSVSDVIFAHRLGTLAVDNAMAGYTDFMISQWLTEYVLVPLKLVVMGRKRVRQDGIFWKSVLANTGQPEKLA